MKSFEEKNPGQAYAVLKKMGAQQGDFMNEGTFRLTEHVEANMSIAMSAEKIAEHFSSISQEYLPLDINSLPKYVQDIMEESHLDNLPTVSELEVYEKIQKAKKPKGGVPGDLPKKLVHEFAPELAQASTIWICACELYVWVWMCLPKLGKSKKIMSLYLFKPDIMLAKMQVI